jgi:hypothetical protein
MINVEKLESEFNKIQLLSLSVPKLNLNNRRESVISKRVY